MVARDLFDSTQDADSEGEEGRYFAWNEDDIRAVVPPEDGDLTVRAFGVEAGGNFEHGRSVLHRPIELAVLAKWFNRSEHDIEAALDRARALLLTARQKRVPPATDDKVIAGWNGLAMHGVAAAQLALATAVDLPVSTSSAIAHELTADGRLLRTWRGGQAKIPAFAEDHAFLAEGELAIFEATGDVLHLQRARRLADQAIDLFADPEGGFFLTPAGGEELIQRPRSVYDNAVPSATSSMTMALLRLHAITGEGRYADIADRTLRRYQEPMIKNPFAYGYLLCALESALSGLGNLVVTGEAGDTAREALLTAARQRFEPNLVIVPWRPSQEAVPEIASLVAAKPTAPGAYLCRNGTCSSPARSVDALEQLLST
jgi:uncharacterized protein YyaL (SSP411 family)